MMVFGRKCPSCGGRHLTERLPVTRLATVPTARTYACSDCRQQLQYPFYAPDPVAAQGVVQLPGTVRNRGYQISVKSEG